MHKILVTGSNGQLGSEIRDISSSYPHFKFTFVDRSTFDLSSPETLEKFFNKEKFDYIINCAAYTAVDKAESDEALADIVNHLAVEKLAHLAKTSNTSLIHISTDYVFDGKNFRPYLESDVTNPISVYGKTKLAGEKAIVRIAPPNSIIIRTAWVYSHHGNNFMKTMIRLGRERGNLGIIYDQIGTPTYARDLAKVILTIIPEIKNTTPQIYHYSNEGAASWFDFAKAIFELTGIDCKVRALMTEEYPTAATRPYNSHLCKTKIKKEFNIEVPFWRDSLRDCLQKVK